MRGFLPLRRSPFPRAALCRCGLLDGGGCLLVGEVGEGGLLLSGWRWSGQCPMVGPCPLAAVRGAGGLLAVPFSLPVVPCAGRWCWSMQCVVVALSSAGGRVAGAGRVSGGVRVTPGISAVWAEWEFPCCTD